ncbi:uncharacterized protein RCO7_15073 [Rhynchosporium graminicola]|uniref:Uncharacterized protein n=1 Tax=Rhynchosporium graminicola TaxID=2792576 RepID=A0A1E1LKZ4_9HELO|nr:uncharacterized protein RCO7_15073 [Rhynchosporium commune]
MTLSNPYRNLDYNVLGILGINTRQKPTLKRDESSGPESKYEWMLELKRA